jgi:hypothetical protein
VMRIYGCMTRFPTGAMSVVKSTILVHAMVLNGSRVCGEDIPMYDTVPFGAVSVLKSNTHVYVMVPEESHVYGNIKTPNTSMLKLKNTCSWEVPNGSHIDEQPRLPLGTVACITNHVV